MQKFLAALREARQRTPSGCRRALWAWLRNRNVTWFERLGAAYLVRWARKRKLDHIHVHFGAGEATVAWLAGLMGGPTYSLTLHAFDIFRDSVDRRLLSAKINGSRFTMTVCESNRRFMLDNLPGVDAERIRVNYNDVDLERFAANGAAREPLSVFAVGRLIEKKGFIHLVRAVRRLRDDGMKIRCRIAGEGPEYGRLREAIREAGLQSHVKLLGSLPQEHIREQLRRAACFVLPCVRALDGNMDALPTVLLEAQACGCPAVSTRLSGIPETIEDGVSGRLVEPDDPHGLAEAMRGILLDQAAADRLSAGGRRRAEQRFDVRANVGVMRDWLISPSTEPTHGAEALADKPPVAPARKTRIRTAEAT